MPALQPLSLATLDDAINEAKTQRAALDADYATQRDRLQARIAKLSAVRARITPEIEQLIALLNDAVKA